MVWSMKAPIIDQFLPSRENTGLSMREGAVAYRAASQKMLVAQLREGFPISEFHALQELLLISEEELGRFLGVSPATLHRRKKSGHLETPESERVVRFARLFGLAMGVFEAEGAAREWLKTSNPATADEAPLSYADTEFGAREVENVLGRLDYGVFS